MTLPPDHTYQSADETLLMYQAARVRAQAEHKAPDEVFALLGIANYWKTEKKPEQAWASLEEALQLSCTADEPICEAQTLAAMARMRLEENATAAEALLQKAMRIYREQGHRREEADCLVSFALEQRPTHPATARFKGHMAVNFYRRLGMADIAEEIAALWH